MKIQLSKENKALLLEAIADGIKWQYLYQDTYKNTQGFEMTILGIEETIDRYNNLFNLIKNKPEDKNDR